MPQIHHPNWEQKLDEIAGSVEACLASLNQYEAGFADLLADSPLTARPPRSTVSTMAMDPHAAEWEARLREAALRANEVERLLVTEEREWERWQATFAAWRNRIEQPPATRTLGERHVEVRGDSAGGGEIDPVRRDGEKAVRVA